ncbi:PqqD family protein [Demequina subtropica]|uniref:PqqD family protein n=1 Tax=Demequina subtropica TaxID=1638989 RepID=UPI00078556BF|nr:PqqD family protein [Demequina subtropica]
MTPASSLRRVPGIAEVLHDDRAVVLNLPRVEQQQSPYLFEGTAFEIWTRIDGTRSVDDVAGELVAAHGGEAGEIAEAVASFVAQLTELGLVERIAPLN